MPKGPRGQSRPADVIKGAMRVVQIATHEIEDDVREPSPKAKGGAARAKALTPKKRKAIAKKAAAKRWAKKG